MDYNELLFTMIKNKIPFFFRAKVKDELNATTPFKLNSIASADFKDNKTGLMYSLLLGFIGADRFYKGNYILGILKPLLVVLAFCMTYFAKSLPQNLQYTFRIDEKFLPSEICNLFNANSDICSAIATKWFLDNQTEIFTYSFVYIMMFYLAWVILDVFFVYFGIKFDNYKKIQQILKLKI